MFVENGVLNNAMKGYSMYYFVIIYGQPCHDATTTTNVNTAPVRLDISW